MPCIQPADVAECLCETSRYLPIFRDRMLRVTGGSSGVSLSHLCPRRDTLCLVSLPAGGPLTTWFLIPMIEAEGSGRPVDLAIQCRLKNWTSRSCCSAALRVLNVPKFRLRPVFASFLRE